MHLFRIPRAFEPLSGLQKLPKKICEKRVKSVIKYFHSVSASRNKGRERGNQECNYKIKSGRV